MSTTYSPRVKYDFTKLEIPHKDSVLQFAYPAFEGSSYEEVGQKILSKDLRIPTGEEMASLLYTAFCDPSVQDSPEFEDVRMTILRSGLWVFNRNLHAEDGDYVLPDPTAIGRKEFPDIKKLDKMLLGINGSTLENGVVYSEDRTVLFAPRLTNYPNTFTKEEISLDSRVIANYGVEGAKKLGEISIKFPADATINYHHVMPNEDPKLYHSGLCKGYLLGELHISLCPVQYPKGKSFGLIVDK